MNYVIPDYTLIPSNGGCSGCAIRPMLNVRCSQIPCQPSSARGPRIAVINSPAVSPDYEYLHRKSAS